MSLGYYRGDRAAMINDMARVAGGVPLKIAPAITPLPSAPPPPPPSIAATVVVPKMSTNEAKQKGYTGNSCQDCGSPRMKIAGHCEVCEDCGSSSGCS